MCPHFLARSCGSMFLLELDIKISFQVMLNVPFYTTFRSIITSLRIRLFNIFHMKLESGYKMLTKILPSCPLYFLPVMNKLPSNIQIYNCSGKISIRFKLLHLQHAYILSTQVDFYFSSQLDCLGTKPRIDHLTKMKFQPIWSL